MKWMGWSWDDLLAAPAELVQETIPEMMREEQRAMERARN